MNKRELVTDRERAWKDADDWYEKYLLERMHTSRLVVEVERLREERDKLKKALRTLIALTATALKEKE